ncbi:unnamed protein product [Tetraodon nigroviridis]|uniref:Chromosome undetermined SCAF7488, whole genome shotgun sequence n=1 Tax=Tetraodon nigroviridis TaxID=99883 RepID=Q4T9V3_TETNG|nr:unnamed protein product [Tetraodon nigroviridis]
MGDSDDEFDRRRRDKFRRERSDMERSREREDRRRDDWQDSRMDVCRQGVGPQQREEAGLRPWSPGAILSVQTHQPSAQTPEERLVGRTTGGSRTAMSCRTGEAAAAAGTQGWGRRAGTPTSLPCTPSLGGHPLQGRLGLVDPDLPPPGPPTLKSFKEFLLNMDDNMDETESVKRYNQYKLDFRRQQLQDFFLQHKDQEWFRSKFHPDDMAAKRAESLAALKTRLRVFLFLLDNSWLDKVLLDVEHAASIIKLMDAAVIKMEGGTDFDLQVLEVPAAPAASGGDAPRPGAGAGAGEPRQEDRLGASRSAPPDPEAKAGPAEEASGAQQGRKRKRSLSVDSGEGSASESDSSHSDGEKEEEEEEDREHERRKERGKVREKPAPVKPRPLHLTTSLFIRSIPPEVSKDEITALCGRYAGFLRVALSDPQPEQRFFRRCWVTFDRSVNIKETCWNLQNVRLRDCELAPVVNRDLCRRVRSVNGLTHHKPVVRNDIRLSARLIQSLDQRAELWAGQMETNPVLKNITDYLIEEVSAEEEELAGTSGSNGDDAGDGKDSSDVAVETDDKLLKVLDRLLLYLRLVHSVDYYNFCEYPAEDEMPHRCGLIHVRGPLPLGKITPAEGTHAHAHARSLDPRLPLRLWAVKLLCCDWTVSEHQKMCEERLAPLLNPADTLSHDDAAKLGRKVPEQEVEKFLSANSVELSKDKWLCPLSGKKFKAPEFVRKHILNKHGDKVAAVRQEVEFFNNYLLDAKRPSPPENKPLPPPTPAPPPSLPGFPAQAPQQQSLLGYPPGVRPPMPAFPGGPPFPPNQFGAGRGNYDNFRGHLGGGGVPKPRSSQGPAGGPSLHHRVQRPGRSRGPGLLLALWTFPTSLPPVPSILLLFFFVVGPILLSDTKALGSCVFPVATVTVWPHR